MPLEIRNNANVQNTLTAKRTIPTVANALPTWVTLTPYIAGDYIEESNKIYKCLVAHTGSALFSTDLTANNWVEISAGGKLPERINTTSTLKPGSYDLDTSGGSFDITLANEIGTWSFYNTNKSLTANSATLKSTGLTTFTNELGVQIGGDFVLNISKEITVLHTELGNDYRVSVDDAIIAPSTFTPNGAWNAATNTPNMNTATNRVDGSTYYVYYITDTGTQDLGNGAEAFQAGGRIEWFSTTVYNYIAPGSETIWLTDTTSIYPSNIAKKVGIGTQTPTHILTLQSDATTNTPQMVVGNPSISGNYGTTYRTTIGAGAYFGYMGTPPNGGQAGAGIIAGSGKGISFYTDGNSGDPSSISNSPSLNILQNGNIGANITTPSNTVHIGTPSVANTGGLRLPITSTSLAQIGQPIGVNTNGDVVRLAATSFDATVDFSVNPNPNTVGTIFNPNIPASTTVLYVSTIDGSQWTYNGTAYVSAPISSDWKVTGNTSTASSILGSTDNTAVNIQSGTANLNIGATVTAQNINIGTGAAAKVITIGNQTGATGLTFNSGTAGETHISTANVGAVHFFSAPNLSNGIALQAISGSTSKIANSAGLDARVEGALTTPSITTFGANIQNTHTGTTLTNVGLQVSATGGTNNYALLAPNGNVGIGTSTPTTPLEVKGNSVFATQAATATIGNTTSTAPTFLRFAGNANFLMGVNGSTTNGSIGAGHGFFGSPGLNSFHIATALASAAVTGIYLDGLSTNVGIKTTTTPNTLSIGTASVVNTGGIRLPITSASANQTGSAIGVNAAGDIVKIAGGGATSNKFRVVQNLVAGDNTITHNLALTTPFATIVETRDNTTGSLITSRVLTETTNSLIINVASAATNVKITIIG